MMFVKIATKSEIQLSKNWGIWEKEVAEFDWEYSNKETCFIIEGEAEVTAENGEKISFKAGDLVVFNAGLKCTWKITKNIRKKYKFGE